MSPPRSRRSRLALIVTTTLFMGAAACADDSRDRESGSGSRTSTSRSGAPADSGRLLLLDMPTWKLTEAVDYRAGLGVLEQRDPDLDWFAEYDGPRADNSDGSYTVPHVTTSGHTAGLDGRRSQLPGFEHRVATVDGRQALISSAAESSPAIVIIEVDSDYSVTLLTYDVGVDLTELAAHLVTVDEEQWTAAGGTLLDCVPFEPGCPGQE